MQIVARRIADIVIRVIYENGSSGQRLTMEQHFAAAITSVYKYLPGIPEYLTWIRADRLNYGYRSTTIGKGNLQGIVYSVLKHSRLKIRVYNSVNINIRIYIYGLIQWIDSEWSKEMINNNSKE